MFVFHIPFALFAIKIYLYYHSSIDPSLESELIYKIFCFVAHSDAIDLKFSEKFAKNVHLLCKNCFPFVLR